MNTSTSLIHCPLQGKVMLTLLPRKLEWSGFVLNSSLLWKDGEDKDINMLDGDVERPLGLITDPSVDGGGAAWKRWSSSFALVASS
ncbi:hypothetical protein V6N11_040959 [Hibiscus sabdariffa]|uniref:Uncharacterized protein n=1 Tax=Hibiscus sabdariffa TaxID=183260 RepID=A0ABR2RJ31_9ROSI